MSTYTGLRLAATICLDYDHTTSPAYTQILSLMARHHCTACNSRGTLPPEPEQRSDRLCTHPGVDPWTREALTEVES